MYSLSKMKPEDIENIKQHKDCALLIEAGWEVWHAHGDSDKFDDGEILFRRPHSSSLPQSLDEALVVQKILDGWNV